MKNIVVPVEPNQLVSRLIKYYEIIDELENFIYNNEKLVNIKRNLTFDEANYLWNCTHDKLMKESKFLAGVLRLKMDLTPDIELIISMIMQLDSIAIKDLKEKLNKLMIESSRRKRKESNE